MKFFTALSFATLSQALQLDETLLAQLGTSETIGDVTHPDIDGQEATILDRVRSTKKLGKLSYQLFFDGFVSDSLVQTNNDDINCGGTFVEGPHMCCFKFQLHQPFKAATTTTRWSLFVQHNCPVIDLEYAEFFGLAFTLDGGVSAPTHDYTLTATANDGEAIYLDDGKISIELNNAEHADHSSFAVYWNQGAFDEENWGYSYSFLERAAKTPSP